MLYAWLEGLSALSMLYREETEGRQAGAPLYYIMNSVTSGSRLTFPDPAEFDHCLPEAAEVIGLAQQCWCQQVGLAKQAGDCVSCAALHDALGTWVCQVPCFSRKSSGMNAVLHWMMHSSRPCAMCLLSMKPHQLFATSAHHMHYTGRLALLLTQLHALSPCTAAHRAADYVRGRHAPPRHHRSDEEPQARQRRRQQHWQWQLTAWQHAACSASHLAAAGVGARAGTSNLVPLRAGDGLQSHHGCRHCMSEACRTAMVRMPSVVGCWDMRCDAMLVQACTFPSETRSTSFISL